MWEMPRFHTALCTTAFTVQHKEALTRTKRGVGGPAAQPSTLDGLVGEVNNSKLIFWQRH